MSDLNTIQVINGDTTCLKRTALDSEPADGDHLIPAKKPAEEMADDKVHEIYQVPEKVVGLVIGKGGSEIRQIQQQSGCRVQMEPDNTSANGFRNCVLDGTAHQVALARQLITAVIHRQGQPAAGSAPLVVPGEMTEDYLIPAEKCGLVIGKGGETIRNIQEQAGLRSCNVVQDSSAPTGQPKPLRMVGSAAAIEQAKQLVNHVMANMGQVVQQRPYGGGVGGVALHGGFGAHDGQAKGEVIVPRLSAGMIIGKGGETIKRLAQETGTKIQFKPDDNPNSEERVAVVMGTRDQIYRATERITEIVNRAIKNNGSSSSTQQVFYMHVPAGKCGLVIGKGGENIKQIERETGAHCGLAPASEQKKEDEKVFEIKGTQAQIHHASHLMRIKVGELAPNTPVPPMPGQAYPTTFQPQNSGFQQGAFIQQQQQFGMAQQWNAQQHHEAFQQPAQQVAHVQQPAQQVDPNAPTVNPTTGAPDYSAQWAAYYRSIGLTDQAAMVETQMRRNQAAAAAASSAAPEQQYYPQQ